MSDASGARTTPSLGAMRLAAGAVALLLAGAAALFFLSGAALLARNGWTVGAVLVLYALAWAVVAAGMLLALLRAWRLSRAAGREVSSPGGAQELESWPGLHERDGRVTVRCGRAAVRHWAFALGLIASAAILKPLAGANLDFYELLVALVPAALPAMLAMAWGPSGWRLALDGACQSLTLERYGPFRRVRDSVASLPTVQAVSFTDIGRGGGTLTVQLTKGLDWQLDLPADWPPELGRALAARLERLAGIEGQPAAAFAPQKEETVAS